MTLDYYYGDQAEQFSFYRIPKVLFTDSRFKDISAEAKILYGLLLDRMSLSAKNGWLDQVGRVYIVYTVEDIMDALSCASQKAMKLLNELDEKCGLKHIAVNSTANEHTPINRMTKLPARIRLINKRVVACLSQFSASLIFCVTKVIKPNFLTYLTLLVHITYEFK